jgi:hypothetical protein
MTGHTDGNGRTPFPGNVIPLDPFHPFAMEMIRQLQLRNPPGERNDSLRADSHREFSPTHVNSGGCPKGGDGVV